MEYISSWYINTIMFITLIIGILIYFFIVFNKENKGYIRKKRELEEYEKEKIRIKKKEKEEEERRKIEEEERRKIEERELTAYKEKILKDLDKNGDGIVGMKMILNHY
jgi:beta-lactamase regulating signal transducer with metallopeptidase domain